jgi:L-lactate dehydrogenase complex protein LldE
LTEAPRTVSLFVTCLVDQVLPEVGIASVHLLERLGFEVDFPAEQTCCGQPFFNSGFPEEARLLAKKTIQDLEGCETVILPGGSCTAMIRAEYAHLLEGEPEWVQRAEDLAGRTFELSEFLDMQDIPWEAHKTSGSLTYHDSCHMCRTLGIRGAPRRLLGSAGFELAEMAEPDRCCGFGGLFSIRMPEVSAAMTAEKLKQAADTGAGTLATADPGCLMTMRRADDSLPDPPKIEHIAVLLERSTR